MPDDKKREPLAGELRTIYHGGVFRMKRTRCLLGCVNWRNVILYALVLVLATVLLCLMPRWVLCFLVVGLILACGALIYLRT